MVINNKSKKQNDMKITKKFEFDTPLISNYGDNKGQTVAFLRIAGEATKPDYMQDDEFDADLIDFKVLLVRCKLGQGEQCVTFAYIAAKGIKSDFADAIDDAVKAHMEYLFSDEHAKYEGDYTDTVQTI